jgi:hypothetical protein
VFWFNLVDTLSVSQWHVLLLEWGWSGAARRVWSTASRQPQQPAASTRLVAHWVDDIIEAECESEVVGSACPSVTHSWSSVALRYDVAFKRSCSGSIIRSFTSACNNPSIWQALDPAISTVCRSALAGRPTSRPTKNLASDTVQQLQDPQQLLQVAGWQVYVSEPWHE